MSDVIVEQVVADGLSEEDLMAVAEAAAQAIIDQQNARNEIFASMAREIEGKLTSRMGSRKSKESQWLESLRLYLGSLSSYNLVTGEYPFGVSEDKNSVHRPEVNIVRNKCETAISQTMTFQFAAGDKNWDLRPPQSFEVDEYDVAQMQQLLQPSQPDPSGQQAPPQPLSKDDIINAKISLMEAEMQTHLENTSYGVESRKAGWDRVVLGTGVMKLPTNSTKLRKVYQKQQTSTGQVIRVPHMQIENVPCVYRVNPWYWFPDDTVTDVRDAEDSIEIHPMSKTQLRELRSNPGFFADQVQEALEEEPRQYTNSPFNDPAYLTQGINLLKNRYLVLEYHGPMSREDLEQLGKVPLIESPDDEYFVEVWVVNGRVIRLEFSNLEGCHRVPYAACTWEPDPATIYGFGIPMLVRDQQRVVNETYKMMLDNAGISAGPQVIVDTTLINPADGGLECTPWKVWYTNEYGADVSKAIQFFMPQNAYEGLSALFSLSMGLADNESSIPNLGPAGPAQASDTATGMAIAQQNASSPLFHKSEQWDDQMTKPLIEALYEWEMQYNPKDEIKGVFDIDVRTSTASLQASLNQQKLERLAMEIAQGSPVGEWIKMDEFAQVRLMDMRLPYKTIIKTPQEIAVERAQRPPPPPDPNMLKAQAELQKVQVDQQRAQVEMQKVQLEAQQKFKEAQMKYEAQLRTDAVREREAQASVIKAQYDYQAQMAMLASKDEQNRQRIVANMQTKAMQLQSDKFLAGVDAAIKLRSQGISQQELQLKRQTGTGI